MLRIARVLLVAVLAGTGGGVRADPPKTLNRIRIGGEGQSVWRVLFSPDGAKFAAHSRTGVVRLWAAADGRSVGNLPANGPAGGLAFAPDGKQ
jgi:WD40 repeat protein